MAGHRRLWGAFGAVAAFGLGCAAEGASTSSSEPSDVPVPTAHAMSPADAVPDLGGPASPVAGTGGDLEPPVLPGGAGAAPTPTQAGVPDGAASQTMECYELRAHDQAVVGDPSPKAVPDGTRDAYLNFTFMPPWEGDVQAVSFRSLIDNELVIHHWLLYQNLGSVPDFAILPSTGQHPDAALLAGWAPGADDLELPPDVGVALGSTGLTLEIHYYNITGQHHTDASGVEVCVTKEPRPNTAALHWLGTETIYTGGPGEVSGTCTPNFGAPITILRSWPHMHLKGLALRSVIRRNGGGEEVLINEPFDFSYQRSYETPAVIMPGDSIVTTCTYDGAATFGPGTGDEMCYNFVLAYPAGSLRTLSGPSLNQNQCFL